MSPLIVILTILAYALLIFGVAHFVGKRSDNADFFIGGRGTSWYMATLAMIGAAMSGVTFISVPGSVAADSMTYMQMVIGFTIGQLIVGFVLIPLFYRLRVVSLYEYLDKRFGLTTHRTGAVCFLVAKVIGASLKIYVVCAVLQFILFNSLGIPFVVNVAFTILLVWLYTRKGGVKVLIPTDVIQSVALVGSVVICLISIINTMGLGSLSDIYNTVASSEYSQMWLFDDPSSPRYFWKMVAGGVLCLVAMTGLDQDMMQRNMSCRSMRDSQINVILTALCQIGVILLLLVLGVFLYAYIDFANLEMPQSGDDVFTLVATQSGLPLVAGIAFVIGVISSTYSAAGSALTSLTTSFTLDIMRDSHSLDEAELAPRRRRVHALMAVVIAGLILLFNHIADESIINLVFRIAGYTYGPILGMFVFGIISRRRLNERWVPLVALLSPVLSYLLQWCAASQYDYHIGFELLGYNALITIIGLSTISSPIKK